MHKELLVALIVLACLVGAIVMVETRKRQHGPAPKPTAVGTTLPAQPGEQAADEAPAEETQPGAQAADAAPAEGTQPGAQTTDAGVQPKGLPLAEAPEHQPGDDTLAGAVPETIAGTYEVKSGDMISKIAEKELGSFRFTDLIMRKNPGIDPEALRPGQKLVMPGREEVAELAMSLKRPPQKKSGTGVSGAIYEIKAKDTLYSIAQRELGSPRMVDEIKALNPGLDPDNLKVGSRIVLPPKQP